MKLFFASDIHGSAYWCRRMLDAFSASGADMLVLLGDILYHGPRNDLPRDYAPKQVIEMLSPLKNKILAVRGNCEAEVDAMVLPFPVMADYAVILEEGTRIYLTHGHLFNPESPINMQSGDIMIYGHTHIPVDFCDDEQRRFINPGSVSIPKADSSNSCLVMTRGEDGPVFEHVLI